MCLVASCCCCTGQTGMVAFSHWLLAILTFLGAESEQKQRSGKWRRSENSRFKMSLWLNLAARRVKAGGTFLLRIKSCRKTQSSEREKSSFQLTHLEGGLEGSCHGYLSWFCPTFAMSVLKFSVWVQFSSGAAVILTMILMDRSLSCSFLKVKLPPSGSGHKNTQSFCNQIGSST